MRARTAAEHVRRHAALPPTDSLSPVGMGLERTDLDASAIRDEEHSPVSPMAEWFETGLDIEEESMSRLQAAPRGTARRARRLPELSVGAAMCSRSVCRGAAAEMVQAFTALRLRHAAKPRRTRKMVSAARAQQVRPTHA